MTTSSFPRYEESRWEGVREVMAMSGPIILGSLSYTVMGFADRAMVSVLGPDALAAVGSADITVYTLSTLFIGITSVVATFAAQCYGRGDTQNCARYCWQGLYVSFIGIPFALLFYLLSRRLFGSMGHSPEVTALELTYFRIRLAGYFFVGAQAALAAFFQAVNRPVIPMLAAIIGNITNLGLNYVLIYGHFGFPALGIGGAALATTLAMVVQAFVLLGIFLNRRYHRDYSTRATWAFDARRCRDLVNVGIPAAMAMFLDIANWWIWISYIIGMFGAVQMAANTIALSFNSIGFMVVIGMHQGIAAVVGQWIGRGDYDCAQRRTHTALKIAVSYMTTVGVIVALFARPLTRLCFPGTPPEVVELTGKILIVAAFFQAFDATNITLMGALRGAGDVRWMMWTTAILAYGFSLPFSYFIAVGLKMETFGAWIGATFFIIILSVVLWRRFEGGRWRRISIFSAPPESSPQDS